MKRKRDRLIGWEAATWAPRRRWTFWLLCGVVGGAVGACVYWYPMAVVGLYAVALIASAFPRNPRRPRGEEKSR